MKFFAHETAVIDRGAKIGENSSIWHFSHICSKAIIGKNVSIGQNVFVGNEVLISNNCKIQNNVSVYENVILEEGVFCGPSMVFTNVYNPRALISRKNEFKNTIVKKGATIGANATIICGSIIGNYAFIAAGAVVRTHVKPYALIAGVPGKQIGWMSEFGMQIPLPLSGKGEYTCPNTKKQYKLVNDKLASYD